MQMGENPVGGEILFLDRAEARHFCFAVFHPGKPYEQCRRTQHQPRHTDQPGGIRSQQSAFSGNGEKDRNLTDDIHNPMDDRGIHDIIASHHDPGTDHADRHANKHHHEHVTPRRAHIFRAIIETQEDQGQVRCSPKETIQQYSLSCAIHGNLFRKQIFPPADLLAKPQQLNWDTYCRDEYTDQTELQRVRDLQDPLCTCQIAKMKNTAVLFGKQHKIQRRAHRDQNSGNKSAEGP